LKALLFFLSGILILGLTFACLFLGGVLFDVAGSSGVDGYVFQPAIRADRRVGTVLSLDQVTNEFVRERLIRKFVSEYFYVIPDAADVARRRQKGSVMSVMASPDVFADWGTTVIPELESLAGRHVLRRVTVLDMLELLDGYLAVSYELVTNDAANILGAEPVATRGVMYLQLDFKSGIRDKLDNRKFDVGRYLERGGDPAGIFKFKVLKVVR
jgi:hypothetical protein